MATLRRSLTILVAMAVLSIFILAQKANNSELIGSWAGSVNAEGREMDLIMELKSEGNKIVGEIRSPHGNWTIKNVTFSGGKWTIAWQTPEGGDGKMIGAVKGNKFAGDWQFSLSGAFEFTKK